MVECFAVGHVLRPQGIKGEVKVEPLTDYIERFEELDYILLEEDSGYGRVMIEKSRYMQDHVVLKLEGYDDRTAAEELRDQYLWIPRSMARELPGDTYFIADIIGCNVYTHKGNLLGLIKDIIRTGSNDVYVIESEHGENILIPALKKVVRRVDIENKSITIDTTEIEGLISHEV